MSTLLTSTTRALDRWVRRSAEAPLGRSEIPEQPCLGGTEGVRGGIVRANRLGDQGAAVCRSEAPHRRRRNLAHASCLCQALGAGIGYDAVEDWASPAKGGGWTRLPQPSTWVSHRHRRRWTRTDPMGRARWNDFSAFGVVSAAPTPRALRDARAL
jgi:hypothetical protein